MNRLQKAIDGGVFHWHNESPNEQIFGIVPLCRILSCKPEALEKQYRKHWPHVYQFLGFIGSTFEIAFLENEHLFIGFFLAMTDAEIDEIIAEIMKEYA